MASEPSSAPSYASPPFDSSKADIILRSSDSVDFRVSSFILEMSSEFFANMLDACQANDEELRDGCPIIQVQEDSGTSLLSLVPPSSRFDAHGSIHFQGAAPTPRVNSSMVRAAGNRTSEDRVARDPQTGAAEGSAEKAAIPYVSSSEPQEIDDLYGGMFETGEQATPLPDGAAVRTASPSNHRDNPAPNCAEQPQPQDRAPSLAVSLPSEHESLATTPRPSMPPSPTPDRDPSVMDVDIIRFRAIPGLWPRCQEELKWSTGDATVAVAMNLNGMAEFMESTCEALKEHVVDKVNEKYYKLEGAGDFWRSILESLGCYKGTIFVERLLPISLLC
ncbi:hypothetical protein DAEQUDRAFT_765644 [Daedalea quercina L-15889]|uniref:BTB domain-containing protein n=1 Tax=Daedalea quercina L-15889 TaxID=1314783 RepID=A0A165QEC2_9APHY|nr:hypothetical protein DAEQUDRAFT_765644 [Daedalea quercina L-15889]